MKTSAIGIGSVQLMQLKQEPEQRNRAERVLFVFYGALVLFLCFGSPFLKPLQPGSNIPLHFL